jgi:hypothetical protein
MMRFFLGWVCFFLLSTGINAQETTNIDSLRRKLAIEKDPCQQSFLLTKMATISKPLNIENAILYAKKGLKLAAPNDCANLGNLYDMLGFFHGAIGKTDMALSYLDTAMLIYKELGDTAGLVKTYGYGAGFYYSLSDYAKATAYAYKGLELNKNIDNKDGDAQLLSTLATISIGQNEYRKGLVYTKRALDIYEEENFYKEGKAVLYYNMGAVYIKLDQLDSASFFYQKALAINKEINNVYGIVTVYLDLAVIYRNQGEREEALNMIYEVEALRGYIPTMAETNVTIDGIHGSIYQMNKEYDKAIPLLTKALEQAQALKTKGMELSVMNRLIDCYESKNDLGQALSFQKQAGVLKDSIFNTTKQQQIKNLEIKYATAKKEQENSLLKEEKKAEEFKVERSKQVILGISVLLFLVLIISYLLIKNNREKATRKNSQLKNQLLRNQMSPHFIFNSLMAIQSFMYKNDLRESSRYLSSFAKLMRAILENSRKEYISLDQELQWLENYMNLQLLRFNNKFEYTIDLDEELDIYSMLIPPMLTQPFIENAIEHGFKNIAYKGKLIVRIQFEKDSLQIEVEDNGIGINNAKQKEEKKEHTSLATIITQERLGYLNKNQSEKIYFDLKAIAPSGTVVRFSIPLKN